MKQILTLLVTAFIWIASILPAQANFLVDGEFIHDMKVFIEGKPSGEVANKILDANLTAWVDLGKSYCEMRRQGMNQSEALDLARTQLQEVENPETQQAIWLLNKTMARVAKGSYCPEFS